LVAAAYNLLLWLFAPAAVPLVALRMRWRGRPWRRVGESLGFPPRIVTHEAPGAIWVHAVSVGEALLAVSLVRRLRERFPDRRIVVSTATPTGQDIAREKLSRWADAIFYAPFDFPWAVRATMRAVRPALLVVLETEIWPNLFREAKRHGAGLLLVWDDLGAATVIASLVGCIWATAALVVMSAYPRDTLEPLPPRCTFVQKPASVARVCELVEALVAERGES